jgi:DNA replication and repair protein RecF
MFCGYAAKHPDKNEPTMHITTLKLHDFRNFQRLDLTFTAGITLLYGPNAAGKTSLLESLFYIATTRSPRVSADREMVRWGAQPEAGTPPFARLLAEVQRGDTTLALEVIVQLKSAEQAADASSPMHSGATRKLVRINRRTVRAIDLIGHLRVVLFTPADLVLVEGSPAERRRYLDTTLSQLDPHYVRTLSQYNKLVQQRNSLLRAWRERRRPLRAVDQELGYWDSELAASGGYILAERLRAITDLNTLVGPLYQQISGGSAPLSISYQPAFDIGAATDAGTLTQRMSDHLQTLRRDELQRGQTLIGPHRDDLLFMVDGINLGIYGSRGQQRSVALALKLGEADFMYKRSGDTPVLLLDDVLSELDMQRRSHVLQTISRPGQQTFLTATDIGNFDATFLQSIRRIRVEEGQVFT